MQAAISLNHAFDEINVYTADQFDIRVAIGIDHGDVLLIGGPDYFGDTVNTASKLGEDQARPGEILITERARSNPQQRGLPNRNRTTGNFRDHHPSRIHSILTNDLSPPCSPSGKRTRTPRPTSPPGGLSPRAPLNSSRSRLSPTLCQPRFQRGIHALYSHQAEALEAARRGENVVLATGTASGKTLAYNLPVLATLIENPQARALYLFPTKALTQDQFKSSVISYRSSTNWTLQNGTELRIYDGDTPQSHRSQIRKTANILLTNPDMLHTGILPHHTNWDEFFRNLKFVVIDELHTYRGVFGSHVANVIRRLKRVAAFSRRASAIHSHLCHHRKSRRTGGETHRGTRHTDRPGRLFARRTSLPHLQSAHRG